MTTMTGTRSRHRQGEAESSSRQRWANDGSHRSFLEAHESASISRLASLRFLVFSPLAFAIGSRGECVRLRHYCKLTVARTLDERRGCVLRAHLRSSGRSYPAAPAS